MLDVDAVSFFPSLWHLFAACRPAKPLCLGTQKARHVSPLPSTVALAGEQHAEKLPLFWRRCREQVRGRRRLTLCTVHVTGDHAAGMMTDTAGVGCAMDEGFLQLPEVGGGRGCRLEVPAQAVAHRAHHTGA